MILDSKSIKYEIVDITEPGKETEKELMQEKATSKGCTISDPNPRYALPPQMFYDANYCGDYDVFDMANELDTLEDFLKLTPEERCASQSQLLHNTNNTGDEEKVSSLEMVDTE